MKMSPQKWWRSLLTGSLIELFVVGFLGCQSSNLRSISGILPAHPVIVLVISGTNSSQELADLSQFDQKIRETFPTHEIRWTFASEKIIQLLKKEKRMRVLREKSITLYSELLFQLIQEGKRYIIVQPLWLVHDEIYTQLVSTPLPKGMEVLYGNPFLHEQEDLTAFWRLLEPNLTNQPGTAYVFFSDITHSSTNYHELYTKLYHAIPQRSPFYTHTFFLGTEDPFTPVHVFSQIKQQSYQRVHFIPLMMMVGEEIESRIMGNQETSYRLQLGLPVSWERGLITNPEISKLYIARIQGLLNAMASKHNKQ